MAAQFTIECPRCGSHAAVRVQRTPMERVFKTWRANWKKMECDICLHLFWVQRASSGSTVKGNLSPAPK